MSGTARTLTNAYDTGGRRNSLTFPDSYLFGYTYDAAGRLASILENNNPASIAASFAYDSAGRPSGWASSAVSTSYGYDTASRLQTLGHNLAAASADQSLAFAYNPASQITSRTSANDLYASNRAYNVDRAYAVNGLNQYTAAGPAGEQVTFGYDANGNLTSGGGENYVYDAENRLVSASGGHNATLTYDPLGRLWQVSGGVGSTQFLYDGDELVAEYDGATGSVLRRYAHGLGSDDPVIWYEGAALSQPHSLHADHQGSIVAVANGTGTATAINAYDSWGIPNASNAGRFQYTGQAWLPELGLYYYKARIYSPTLGRFLQTDPVGYDDQINLYAYVGNDPVNSTDPSGMARCTGDPRCDAVHEAAAKARDVALATSSQLRSLAAAVAGGSTLDESQSSLRDTFEKKFGAGSATSAALNRAAGHFDRVARRIGEEGSGARIRLTNSDAFLGRARVGGSSIELGRQFFRTDADGVVRGAWFVMLHEGGHLAGLGDQALPSNAPQNIGRRGRGGILRAYGRGATDWLGENDPSRARANNDSYNCVALVECGL